MVLPNMVGEAFSCHMKIILLSALSLCAFTSCASIVSKSDYLVIVKSDGAPVAFKVKKQSGEILHKGMTPATVILSASEGYFRPAAYSVTTAKGAQPLNASMDPWYAGNVLVGGLIGIVVVDPLTGSMWKLPKEVHMGSKKQPE